MSLLTNFKNANDGTVMQPVFRATKGICKTGWQDICATDDIVEGTGVAARVNGQQIAVFHTQQGFFAIGNLDPFSGANVLARGLLGDIAGVLVVASPVYKQHFCLRTGQCLEDPDVKVPAFVVRLCEQNRRILIRTDVA